ncbi:hypothetical protein OAX78_01555 [Planctomycetota bacterium]|nr:hypothetical protein [Planctomycetota bacterium]
MSLQLWDMVDVADRRVVITGREELANGQILIEGRLVSLNTAYTGPRDFTLSADDLEQRSLRADALIQLWNEVLLLATGLVATDRLTPPTRERLGRALAAAPVASGTTPATLPGNPEARALWLAESNCAAAISEPAHAAIDQLLDDDDLDPMPLPEAGDTQPPEFEEPLTPSEQKAAEAGERLFAQGLSIADESELGPNSPSDEELIAYHHGDLQDRSRIDAIREQLRTSAVDLRRYARIRREAEAMQGAQPGTWDALPVGIRTALLPQSTSQEGQPDPEHWASESWSDTTTLGDYFAAGFRQAVSYSGGSDETAPLEELHSRLGRCRMGAPQLAAEVVVGPHFKEDELAFHVVERGTRERSEALDGYRVRLAEVQSGPIVDGFTRLTLPGRLEDQVGELGNPSLLDSEGVSTPLSLIAPER